MKNVDGLDVENEGKEDVRMVPGFWIMQLGGAINQVRSHAETANGETGDMGIGWVRECGTEKLVIMFPWVWSLVLGGECGFRSGQHVGSKWSLEVIKITQGSMLSEMRRPRAEP